MEPPPMQPVDLQKFREATRPLQLTIQKFLALPEGVAQNYYCLDRNLEDLCEETDVPTPARIFLNGAYKTTLTRLPGGLSAKWKFDCQREADHRPFDIELPGYDCPNRYFWYPLGEDQHVPTQDDQLHTDLGPYAGKHWQRLRPDTRIGWRGPMIHENDLALCPPIIWEDV